MTTPSDRRYLATHEWHKLDGNIVTIGISQFAADELTDITYVALPKVGAAIAANARFGEIESVKATADLYSGIAGVVTEINAELTANPGIVNTDPYGKGWMIRVKADNTAELKNLLPVDQYLQKTGH
jgi:glycine cleavage system H protein